MFVSFLFLNTTETIFDNVLSHMKSILIINTYIFKIFQEHQIKQLDLIPKRECKGNHQLVLQQFSFPRTI